MRRLSWVDNFFVKLGEALWGDLRPLAGIDGWRESVVSGGLILAGGVCGLLSLLVPYILLIAIQGDAVEEIPFWFVIAWVMSMFGCGTVEWVYYSGRMGREVESRWALALKDQTPETAEALRALVMARDADLAHFEATVWNASGIVPHGSRSQREADVSKLEGIIGFAIKTRHAPAGERKIALKRLRAESR